MHEASVDSGGKPQAVIHGSNCSFEDVADKVKIEKGWERKLMLISFDVKYANAVGKICGSVVRDNYELLWNAACCTALVSTHVDKICGLLPVKARLTLETLRPLIRWRLWKDSDRL